MTKVMSISASNCAFVLPKYEDELQTSRERDSRQKRLGNCFVTYEHRPACVWMKALLMVC